MENCSGFPTSLASGSAAWRQGDKRWFCGAFSSTYSTDGSVSNTGASLTSTTSMVSTLITLEVELSLAETAVAAKGSTYTGTVS